MFWSLVLFFWLLLIVRCIMWSAAVGYTVQINVFTDKEGAKHHVTKERVGQILGNQIGEQRQEAFRQRLQDMEAERKLAEQYKQELEEQQRVSMGVLARVFDVPLFLLIKVVMVVVTGPVGEKDSGHNHDANKAKGADGHLAGASPQVLSCR